MSSREEFEAWVVGRKVVKKHGAKLNTTTDGTYCDYRINDRWLAWTASRAQESDLLSALQAITNSGPDAIPIKEAFEMAHRAIERATGVNV